MKICNEFHPEVCFDDERGSCPVCEQIQELEMALAKHEEDVGALSARVEELLDEREGYRSELRL